VATTAGEWLDSYAAALGVDPLTAEEVDELLVLAGVAAHSSERTAAPVACYLAARACVALGEAVAMARSLDSAGGCP